MTLTFFAAFFRIILTILMLLPFIADLHAAPAVPLRLDSVEISGVTQIAGKEIEAALEIGPSDSLDREKIIKSAENIQKLYLQRGYENPSIKSRLIRRKSTNSTIKQDRADHSTESILEFIITEGPLAHLEKLEIILAPTQKFISSDIQKKLDRLKKKIISRFEHEKLWSIHEVVTPEKIEYSKKLIYTLLDAEEYIGSKVEEIKQEISRTHKIKSIFLQFQIDLGERVSFGFRGNESIPSSRLFTLIEDQKAVGLGKNYIRAILLKIEEEYHSLGYAQVQITPYTYESLKKNSRHVTFAIKEGPQVWMHSIEFDGNQQYSANELQEQLLLKSSPLIQQGYYIEKDIQKSAELLIDWMKSQGYLSAKLISIHTTTVEPRLKKKSPPRKKVTIYLYEGEQTLINTIEFSGNHVYTHDELIKILGINKQSPLNLFQLSERLDWLKAYYRSEGYLSITILNENTDKLVHYSHENRAADIKIQINEGPLWKTSKIQLEGLGKTKEDIVLREVTFHPGEVLKETQILETESRLRRLGIFSAAVIRLNDDPEQPGYKMVRILLEEASPGVFEWGFGFRNDLGLRAFGQIGYSNLWSRNHTLSVYGTANRRLENFSFAEGQAQLTYLWPWFLNLPEVNFRPTLGVGAAKYLKFSAFSVSLSAGLERKILKNPNLTGFFSYSIERILQFNATEEIDNQDVQLGSLSPSLVLDLRDNPLSPSRGFYASTSFEYSSPWLLPQKSDIPISYNRFQFRSDYYLPLSHKTTWFFSFRTGYERSNIEKDPTGQNKRLGAIPAIKTFTLGGPGSLRGFREQQLNVYDYVIYGSVSYVNYRTQLDLPFIGSFRFGPFLDAANLNIDTFDFGNLRYGTGVGFRYQTPVGPINIDFGFNLNPIESQDPKKSEDKWRFHITVGVI